MKDTILLVFGYGGAQAMFDRHLPYFLRGEADIMVVSPSDSPLAVPANVMGFTWGVSQHYGHSLMERHERAISAAIGMGYETICCIEADSIVLKEIPNPSTGNGIDCFLFNNDPASGFKAKQYMHWPWLMSRDTAVCLATSLRWALKRGEIEQGFPDRMAAFAAEFVNIPLIHSPNLSYSQNRLDTPQKMQEARMAIANGAVCIHGLKTAQELEELTR